MEQEWIDINWESDFDFILTLLDERDVNLGVPDWDWEAELYTTSVGRRVVISQIGGVRTGWHEDSGAIHVTVDGGLLLPGELRVKFTAHLPNDHHPDSVESVVHVAPLCVRLIRGNAPCPSTFTSSVILPAIKGDPFTYDDFTPEQLADLRRPATEAAEALNKAETQREQAESERAKAETQRVANEAIRVDYEARRVANENQRVLNETERVVNETIRETQETQRVADEVERKAQELERKSNEVARVSSETERIANETKRTADETARRNSEIKRVEDETARSTAEATRVANETARSNAEKQRLVDEAARVSHETTRENNEAKRVQAETERDKVIQALQGRIAELESQLAEIHSHTYLIAE